MTEKNKQRKVAKVDGNIIRELILRVKLVLRLMGDSRVSGLTKLLPWGSLAYLIMPIDFIPGGLMTVIGAADDVAVMWFGFSLFLELCPPHVVEEHRAQLTGQVVPSQEGEIIDGEVVDLDE